ncbi:hypothetical protein C2845_PM05G26500 [Panicum miliaceum]|uniref:Uncharacterized protein n=1 Tax=Panicum miliaceum TaxID=4540 RepID=A0A3L6SV26_PANMI|nr:hypothetical protein C2845_PM05G26500 [Panicum miliaceum]
MHVLLLFMYTSACLLKIQSSAVYGVVKIRMRETGIDREEARGANGPWKAKHHRPQQGGSGGIMPIKQEARASVVERASTRRKQATHDHQLTSHLALFPSTPQVLKNKKHIALRVYSDSQPAACRWSNSRKEEELALINRHLLEARQDVGLGPRGDRGGAVRAPLAGAALPAPRPLQLRRLRQHAHQRRLHRRPLHHLLRAHRHLRHRHRGAHHHRRPACLLVATC